MAATAGKYPVVNPEPTVDLCFNAARPRDYVNLVGITGASWVFGFLRGRPARFVMAGLMGTIGFTFGTCIILQNTRNRFLGTIENSREVEIYGLYKPDPNKQKPKYGNYY